MTRSAGRPSFSRTEIRREVDEVPMSQTKPSSLTPLGYEPAERIVQPAAFPQEPASLVDLGAPTTLTALIAAQAARVPERVAVVAGKTTRTYAQLGERARELAAHLRALGVARNAPVGLLLDRSADAVVGLLGILEAGGAYMPLSLDAPAAGLAQQLAESGATVVVTAGGLASRLPGNARVVLVDRRVAEPVATSADIQPARPDDLAYVLFTSGSTGTPKGVAVTHANAVHYARAISRVLADSHVDAAGDGFAVLDGWRFGIASTFATDLGHTSLLSSLLAGGTLHVLEPEATADSSRFAREVAAHPLDLLKITPSRLAALTAGARDGTLAQLLPARWLVLGGEATSIDFARELLDAGRCRVLVHYGPTEVTVGACTFEATRAALDAAVAAGARTVPIGRPLANTVAHVVDARGALTAPGVEGELWLAGAGVARGYLNRDALTADRFVERDGRRWYRTGDHVRRLSSGDLEFLGRADDQVKIRGYRVELSAIELTLRAHPGVADAVALLAGENDAERRLVAYVVPRADGYSVSHSDEATSERVREWAAAQLPEHMVPAAVVLLTALPISANGKVDRAALPASTTQRP